MLKVNEKLTHRGADNMYRVVIESPPLSEVTDIAGLITLMRSREPKALALDFARSKGIANPGIKISAGNASVVPVYKSGHAEATAGGTAKTPGIEDVDHYQVTFTVG